MSTRFIYPFEVWVQSIESEPTLDIGQDFVSGFLTINYLDSYLANFRHQVRNRRNLSCFQIFVLVFYSVISRD